VSLAWIIVTVIIAIPLVTTLVYFNRLVTLRNRCNESWSNVDTELKRRHNLVPNLVSAVQSYAKHERSVLEAVTQARTRAMAPHEGAEDQQADENPLVGALRTLFAVAEDYPELKASRNFLSLQEELALTEDRIQAARRFYNANVRDYRNTTRTFPGILFARMFSFETIEYFQIETLHVVVPRVEMKQMSRP
jgi:LemA protein